MDRVWVWVVCVLCAGAGACDTVAEVSFDIRRFDRVKASGVIGAGACQGEDGLVDLRFAILDQSGEVIRPGDRLQIVTVDEETFKASQLMPEGAVLSPVAPAELVVCGLPCEGEGCEGVDPAEACRPAGMTLCVPYDESVDRLDGFEGQALGLCRASCQADGDCDSGLCVADEVGGWCALRPKAEGCVARSDCPLGFECQGEGTESLCVRPAELMVVPETLTFISEPPSGQQEALRTVALVMDNSGSLAGRGVEPSDNTVRSARATDLDQNRIAAATSFLLGLSRRSFQQNTAISMWSFSGVSELGVKPLTGNQAENNPYVSDLDVVKRVLSNNGLGDPDGRSNVFTAIEVVAQNLFDLCDNNPDCETISELRETDIILFTDGPDNSVTVDPGASAEALALGRSRWDDRLASAMDTARRSGARVTIVHLDSAIGPDGLALTRPDPRNAHPFPRDTQGRTGPLEAYAQIACATGGEYIYVTEAVALHDRYAVLVDLLGGSWSVEVAAEGLIQTVEPGAYLLKGELGVNLDGRTTTSRIGERPDLPGSSAVIFKRP